MTGKLQRKAAIVTGSGSGIDAAIAQVFADEGATLVLHDINRNNLSRLKASLPNRDDRLVVCDISEPSTAQAFAAEARSILRACTSSAGKLCRSWFNNERARSSMSGPFRNGRRGIRRREHVAPQHHQGGRISIQTILGEPIWRRWYPRAYPCTWPDTHEPAPSVSSGHQQGSGRRDVARDRRQPDCARTSCKAVRNSKSRAFPSVE